MSECFGDHCVTCSDEGVAMRVVAQPDADGLVACRDDAGAEHIVDVALLEQVGVGDNLLVHAGVALVRVS